MTPGATAEAWITLWGRVCSAAGRPNAAQTGKHFNHCANQIIPIRPLPPQVCGNFPWMAPSVEEHEIRQGINAMLKLNLS